MSKFSERLKELRTQNGFTQVYVSQKTALSQNAIAQWENEKRVPNANAIIALAKFFDVSTDYLLGLED